MKENVTKSVFMQMHDGSRTEEGSFNVDLQKLFYKADLGNRYKLVKAFPEFFGNESIAFGVLRQYSSPKLITFSKDVNGLYSYTLSKVGKQCKFLQFLINTSNFTYKKEKMLADGNADVVITPKEIQGDTVHLLSKLCAIGYLLLDLKDPYTAMAVIGIDGRLREVDIDSCGRSEKVIFGDAIRLARPNVTIWGHPIRSYQHAYIWQGLTKKTKIVCIDGDKNRNLTFDDIYTNIIGDWEIEPSGGRYKSIPFSSSPKIYCTTNRALNIINSRFESVLWVIMFSDYYIENPMLCDEFYQLFLYDCETVNMGLFRKLMDDCLLLYLSFGHIKAPIACQPTNE